MLIQIRAKGFTLPGPLRARMERQMRISLTRFTDRLERVTVLVERRPVLEASATQYICSVALMPVRLKIREQHDQIDVAIDRALGRAGRIAGLRFRQ